MAEYKIINDEVVKRDDGAFIPNDPGNRDWRKYQKWLADGNTPDPDDPKPPQQIPADRAETEIEQSTGLSALVSVLAKDKGITEQEMIQAIRAEAKALK